MIFYRRSRPLDTTQQRPIYTTYSSTSAKDKQLSFADSIHYKQLVSRHGDNYTDAFQFPLGTHSVGYLTKLLKPQFNENKFEESFTTWEFEIARYERDNQAPIPDNIKIAILLNETQGPLQQYLQLRAGAIQRYADIRDSRTHSRIPQSINSVLQDASTTTGNEQQHK